MSITPAERFASPASRQPGLLGPLMLGGAALVLFFGGLGGWAVSASLASAASAPGQVRVESHRKTVQHLEGGIIRDILVEEGDVVAKGEVLVRLDDLQARSGRALIANQRLALQAEEARLLAERDGAEEVAYPAALIDAQSDASVVAILDGQDRIFASGRASWQGQIELVNQRISQFGSEIEALRAQLDAANSQIALTNEERESVGKLLKKGYEKRSRLIVLEREFARLQGDRGEKVGLIAKAEQGIGEARLQIADLGNTRVKDAAAALREVQVRISELGDRLRAADDIETRTAVLAPQAGRVVQLRHVTPGGVLKPGEPILDLVPNEDRFVVDARISPLDIDAVHPGLDAEIKMTGLKQRRLPILLGKVEAVSADALTDERSGQSYFKAEIRLDEAELKRIEGLQLYPGMPSEVLVVTGEGTPFDYIVDPLRDSFHRAFRED